MNEFNGGTLNVLCNVSHDHATEPTRFHFIGRVITTVTHPLEALKQPLVDEPFIFFDPMRLHSLRQIVIGLLLAV